MICVVIGEKGNLPSLATEVKMFVGAGMLGCSDNIVYWLLTAEGGNSQKTR
jgi:hypothetical protein